MHRRNRSRRSAFTLMEVLLVAGILALLAAFAAPKLFQTATKTKIKLTEAAVGTNSPISNALNRYKFDMGQFPDTDQGIDALLAPKDEVDDERYDGPYLANDTLTDSWGNEFGYRQPGQFHEDGFDLWSYGPDGKNDDGSESSDDIKNWIER